MNSKIIICGPAASGKDTLKKRLSDRGFNCSVSCTTRPSREGEIDGKDYHFLSEDEFKKQIEENAFLEWDNFNNWYYGTHKERFNDSQVFIMTKSGIDTLTKEQRKISFVIYLDIPEEIRIKRLKERNDADDPYRRLEADKKDFKNFKNYDLKITDTNF